MGSLWGCRQEGRWPGAVGRRHGAGGPGEFALPLTLAVWEPRGLRQDLPPAASVVWATPSRGRAPSTGMLWDAWGSFKASHDLILGVPNVTSTSSWVSRMSLRPGVIVQEAGPELSGGRLHPRLSSSSYHPDCESHAPVAGGCHGRGRSGVEGGPWQQMVWGGGRAMAGGWCMVEGGPWQGRCVVEGGPWQGRSVVGDERCSS